MGLKSLPPRADRRQQPVQDPRTRNVKVQPAKGVEAISEPGELVKMEIPGSAKNIVQTNYYLKQGGTYTRKSASEVEKFLREKGLRKEQLHRIKNFPPGASEKKRGDNQRQDGGDQKTSPFAEAKRSMEKQPGENKRAFRKRILQQTLTKVSAKRTRSSKKG